MTVSSDDESLTAGTQAPILLDGRYRIGADVVQLPVTSAKAAVVKTHWTKSGVGHGTQPRLSSALTCLTGRDGARSHQSKWCCRISAAPIASTERKVQ